MRTIALLALCAAPVHGRELQQSRLPRHAQCRSHPRLGLTEPRLASTLRIRGGGSVATAGGSVAAPSSLVDTLYVPLAFAGWFLMNIQYSMLNKKVLMVWKFPFTFAALQLLVGSLWICGLWLPMPTGRGTSSSIRTRPSVDMAGMRQLLPISTCLALGHALSTVAPAYGTVAFTNVVKTLEPLFTCALSAVFLGEIFSLPVYLSLVPVIAGVLLASTNEVSFSMASQHGHGMATAWPRCPPWQLPLAAARLGRAQAAPSAPRPSLGSARARLLRLLRLRARLEALGGSTLSGAEAGPLGARPLPRVPKRAASEAANSAAFEHADLPRLRAALQPLLCAARHIGEGRHGRSTRQEPKHDQHVRIAHTPVAGAAAAARPSDRGPAACCRHRRHHRRARRQVALRAHAAGDGRHALCVQRVRLHRALGRPPGHARRR